MAIVNPVIQGAVDVDAMKATSGLSHVQALDGLRGIAVALVVVYHFEESWLPGGYLGVSMFFTLSGFLITRLLLAEVAATGSVDLRRFYDRRFRRLLPAACVTIIGSAAWVYFADRLSLISSGDIFAATFWYFNVHEILRDVTYGGADASVLAHYWSLSIEEQFYLVFPALVLLSAKLSGVQGVRLLVAGALVIAVPAALVIDRYLHTGARVGEIAAGCALAVGLHRRPIARHDGPRVAVAAVAITAVVVFLARVVELPLGGELPSIAILVTSAATLALVLIGLAAPAAAPLANPVLRILGRYSYSIYLWHWPVFTLIDSAAAQILLTVVLSLGSYHLIENPIRRSRAVASG